MNGQAWAWDVFALGFAVGLTLMMASAARRVSPRWLKVSVLICAALEATQYAVLWTGSATFLWMGGMIGLSWPTMVAADQLVRHPAMTPKRLLHWYLPFLLGFGLTLLWVTIVPLMEGVFVTAFVGVCVLLIRKLPMPPIRLALACLALGQVCVGISGLVLVFRGVAGWLLVAEIVMLLALWHAFETAWAQQQ